MDDAALVKALLDEVERRRLGDREAGAEIGLSHEAIRKYRAGEWTRLYPDTRRKIEAWLGRKKAVESATYADGASDAIGEMEAMLTDLRRRLGLAGGEKGDRSPAARLLDEARPLGGPGSKVPKRKRS